MPSAGDGGADPVVTDTRARYNRIIRFAARALVQVWWFELVLPRLGLTRVAKRGQPQRMTRLARRFHALALELGGLMIKVGQFLSSRLDVLPPEITKELEGLQDEVPPLPFAAIRAAAEAELGMPLERAYARFEPAPVAAASLGQAHRARLHDDLAQEVGFAEVVVKVQRPGIDDIVAVDLAALRRVGGWLRRIRVVSERVDAPALVEEFAATSLAETDYLHEAAWAERFAADVAEDPRVDAPVVVWERVTRRVLTLADVTAIKISDADALRAADIDPAAVATLFARVMFDQLFRRGFFHADPHPGNVFVTPDAAVEGGFRLTFIDFGMMGEVPDTLRDGLRGLLIAVAARDSKRLVEGIARVGVLLPDADTVELERAMSTLFARFGGMGFAELRDVDPREFREFAEQFGDVTREMPFQLPENFLLIIRSMSITSGVCSTLDPAFNVWDAVEPYASELLRAESGNLMRDMLGEVASVAAITAGLPRRADALITRLEEGRLTVDFSRLERRFARTEKLATRAVSGVIFSGTLIAGVLLRPSDEVLGSVLMLLSLLPLGHVVLAGWFGRR
ncbi:ABC1 kinase family protein [Microbacterium binotii]|uniref:ABC1 kinase family protein n=1 Tax=Microbacterium binotii TaxID=462710 RepID=UPI001F2ED8FF|nr:AarF/UbiB family protein [Microbacterium binotii]UIN31784.1 AarF/UbiB family protein [Microbacterium binotii]